MKTGDKRVYLLIIPLMPTDCSDKKCQEVIDYHFLRGGALIWAARSTRKNWPDAAKQPACLQRAEHTPVASPIAQVVDISSIELSNLSSFPHFFFLLKTHINAK